ncbi:MAG: ATP-binding cassette domain-containing protein [Thaumarchaeota archaeon]|nr:ATP-binding cassette domain-containing protein [Nitrososphaerota archaeon]
MIEIEGLTKKFGDVTAVEALTLRVEEGEVFGFLGPNGAGKTTTVRMLTCLISKTSGTASIGGHDIGKSADVQEIRKTIGLLPESVGMYDDLSAYKNLDYYGRLYECPEDQRRERIERFLRLLGLWEKRNVAVGTFSKGMKQKLAIARALIHDPRVLFLDEPTANLDPETAKTVRDFILELKKEKRTIFINTHNLDEASKVCDRVGILKTRLIALGATKQLLESLWGRRTVIHLAKVDDAIVSAVRRVGPTSVQVDGNRIIIDVADPAEDNPRMVDAIVAAGGRIQGVTELLPSLEDVYLRLVRS